MTQSSVLSPEHCTQWHAVIMAGGLGERLRPLTGPRLPKPLLPLRSGGTLLSATVARALTLVPTRAVWIVTTQAFRRPISRAVPVAVRPRVIVEPSVRGTATCLAVMAHLIAAHQGEHGMMVFPADHWIAPPRAFRTTLRTAMRQCEGAPNALVCIGIPPTAPHPGYGYMRYQGRHVLRFVEKPSPTQAARLLRAGHVAWNGGIFVGCLGAYQTAFERWLPSLAQAVAALPAQPGAAFTRALARLYRRIPVRSFDRAVLEQHDTVTLVPARFTWHDLGAWDAWPILQRALDLRRLAALLEAQA